jgi:hypothetical protein
MELTNLDDQSNGNLQPDWLMKIFNENLVEAHES